MQHYRAVFPLIYITQWHSTGGACENGAVEVCGNDNETQNSLTTQYINNSLPSHDRYRIRVFLNVSYSFTNCSEDTDCDSDVELVRNAVGGFVRNFMPENHIYIHSDIPTATQQFYTGMITTTSLGDIALVIGPLYGCVSVSRVLVYSYECPDQRTGLTYRPATLAPDKGTVNTMTQCAENSHLINETYTYSQCNSGGEWETDDDYCECDMGLINYNNVCVPIIMPEMNTYTVTETQEHEDVCFHKLDGIAAQFRIVTYDVTAIGKFKDIVHKNCKYSLFLSGSFDYVPVNKTVSFSSDQLQCVSVSVVSDELSEGQESFTVNLISGGVVVSSALVIISSNSEFENECPL